MRPTASPRDGPARPARRRVRPAPQSEHDLPSGRSPARVEQRLLANDGKGGRVASRSPARETPAVASVTLRSTVLPAARRLTEQQLRLWATWQSRRTLLPQTHSQAS